MAAEALRPTNGTTIQTLEKAVDIITTLEDSGEASAAAIAEEIGTTRSTVHVYLETLRQYGYVVKHNGRYRIGLRFLNHGGRARKQVEVYEEAKLEVDRLARETGELADLGVEQNGMRVMLYKSETDRSVYDNVVTGEFTHMHWTALGKALLAWSPGSRVDGIIDRWGLPEATDHTITEPDELRAELERTVERGYAIGEEERRRGIVSIGVPILDAETENAVAALSVAGPRRRIRDGKTDSIVEALQYSANVIELRYAHY